MKKTSTNTFCFHHKKSNTSSILHHEIDGRKESVRQADRQTETDRTDRLIEVEIEIEGETDRKKMLVIEQS